MKSFIMVFVLTASVFAFSPCALADSSVCEVFVFDRKTYTTCDGKQLDGVNDNEHGSVAAVTLAIHRLLRKGYSLKTCSGRTAEQACLLTK